MTTVAAPLAAAQIDTPASIDRPSALDTPSPVDMPMTLEAPLAADRRRRFGGVARLYGDAGSARLADAHAVVVGLGGVGSWVIEALARSGIGRLTLIDMDHVGESNINRQIHALESTLGSAKIDVMVERVRDICAAIEVTAVDDFVSYRNVDTLIPADAAVVIDAIDSPRAKADLIAACSRRRQRIIVCGAAGGRTDPLTLRRSDLAAARGDALLSAVRNRLRREHGFPRETHRSFGVLTVHAPAPERGGTIAPVGSGGARLACAGYGSIVTVTAAMGMAAAGAAIDAIVSGRASRGGSR
jgi:tRNA threonylcarbamoyladenosine dehydratase